MDGEENPEEPMRIELQLPLNEMRVPPDRYPVPATAMPPLSRGELVTLGEPGRWWVVDEAYVSSGPHGKGDEENYVVIPEAEHTAAALRAVGGRPGPYDRGECRGQRVYINDLWIYRDRDHDQDRLITDLPPVGPSDWFDRMPADDLTPPPLRRPRPARELPSLIGQRMRVYSYRGWEWWRAVSEPFQTEDGIEVRIVGPGQWHSLMGGRPLAEDQVWPVALHRLWVY